MAFKKFSEYVNLREFGNVPATPQQQPNANKQGVQDTLQAAMKAPPPAGTNPMNYRQKLLAAIQASKSAPVNSPQQAIDLVNVQKAAAGQ